MGRRKKQAQLFVPRFCGTPEGWNRAQRSGSLSSVEGKAAPGPPRSVREPATRMRVHLRPPVSGWKLGTEETGKQKEIKKGNRFRRDRCHRIKPL